MGVRDAVDLIVKMLGALATWPVVVIFVAFFFRREVGGLITDIGRRLTRAPGGFEFSPASAQAFRDMLEVSSEHFRDDPERFLNLLREELGKLLGAPPSVQGSFKPLSSRSIIWIEKDPENREYVERLFQHLGVRLVWVRSTEEALKQVQGGPFDGIIVNEQ
ncbi:MAG: hypothetical protein HPY50_06025 [Firmicutes bacterium]|nr:hypothetical protein [Bacillota bacterium]